MSDEHAVSIRLPTWFASDGFTLTLEQLQQPDYVLHVFLPELLAFLHDSPEDLEVTVDAGRWRRVGRPIERLVASDGEPRALRRPSRTRCQGGSS